MVFHNFTYYCITDEVIEGKIATVTGWGHTAYKGTTSDYLKEATVRVWRRKRCLESLQAVADYDNTMFCANGGKHDACGVKHTVQ